MGRGGREEAKAYKVSHFPQAGVGSGEPKLLLSYQLQVQSHHVSSLKSAMGKALTPQKSANGTNNVFLFLFLPMGVTTVPQGTVNRYSFFFFSYFYVMVKHT